MNKYKFWYVSQRLLEIVDKTYLFVVLDYVCCHGVRESHLAPSSLCKDQKLLHVCGGQDLGGPQQLVLTLIGWNTQREAHTD